MAKKGHYRKLKRVEILKDSSSYKKGEVREMHPVLANKLIVDERAKGSSKPLTNEPVKPVSKVKED